MLLPPSSYQIHQALAETATIKILINSFIISWVDYCNSILVEITKYQISRVQSILNIAAWVISGQARFDHVTPTLTDWLHWLHVPERIQSKGACLCTRYSTDPLLPTSPSTALLSHQIGIYVHLCSSASAFTPFQDGHARRAILLCRWPESVK